MIIGIDPGKSTGIAIYHGGKLTGLKTIRPHHLKEHISGASRVIFEDSRLQSHLFTSNQNRAVALKMARNVGEIDAWCALITSICDDLGIPAHGISPKAKGAKLRHDAFAKLTGWTGKTNEHMRDAAMVAWMYRGAR